MKKTGQIFAIIIVSLLCIIHVFIFGVFSKKAFIFNYSVAIIIAWLVGRQYDKMKLYTDRMIETEKDYRRLIETIPDAILIYFEGTILYVNEAGKCLLGADKKEEILGQSIYRIIHPSYQEIARERLDQIRKNIAVTNNVEQKIVRLDGKIIYVEVSSRLIHFEGKQAYLSVFEDVTHKKEETEGLLQKSEKLALVGQMAAGIAHEIRNPLTSIRGFIQLFQLKYTEDEQHFELVLSELDRINLIVGEFLVLSKPTAVEFKEKEITNLIRDVVTLINTQAIMNNIQIVENYDSVVPVVICEENQLKQVFINLLKNAIEAMPNGGIIEVNVLEKDKDKVSIFITDQGMGIPEERISKLGEPFYTTKEKGTGLGLMTCYKIIENHDGEMNISSKINEGTLVEILLPTIPQDDIEK